MIFSDSNFKLNRNMYLRLIHIPASDEITLTFILELVAIFFLANCYKSPLL